IAFSSLRRANDSAGMGRLVCPSTSVWSIRMLKRLSEMKGLIASANLGKAALVDMPYQFDPKMRAPAMSMYEPQHASSSQATILICPSSPRCGSSTFKNPHCDSDRNQLDPESASH